jgi:DNA-directed RNA polymerase specialized sigma24 family protein
MNIRRVTFYVHELVASAWLGDRPTGYVIDHIDEIKTNNKAENLRFISRSENTARASSLSSRRRGRKAVLTSDQVYWVRQQRITGASFKDMGKVLGVNEATVRSAVYGITYQGLQEVPALVEPTKTKSPNRGGKRRQGPAAASSEHPSAVLGLVDGEEWKQTAVAGYWVSSLGRVFSAKSRALMKPQRTAQGYWRVQLRTEDGYSNKMVHVLVAECFLPKTSAEGLVVGHLNENPGDPRAVNLGWVSRRDNALSAVKPRLGL